MEPIEHSLSQPIHHLKVIIILPNSTIVVTTTELVNEIKRTQKAAKDDRMKTKKLNNLLSCSHN